MATKLQAKNAIDAAALDAKNDIDNILPVGVNIKDGGISFNPEGYVIVVDAGGLVATADSTLASIQSNLTTATRPFVTTLRRRKADTKNQYVVTEAKLTVKIVNF